MLITGLDPDRWVCRIWYRKPDDELSVRIISPIRFSHRDAVVNAFCLERGEPRNFTVAKIEAIELVPASDAMVGSSQ